MTYRAALLVREETLEAGEDCKGCQYRHITPVWDVLTGRSMRRDCSLKTSYLWQCPGVRARSEDDGRDDKDCARR